MPRTREEIQNEILIINKEMNNLKIDLGKLNAEFGRTKMKTTLLRIQDFEKQHEDLKNKLLVLNKELIDIGN